MLTYVLAVLAACANAVSSVLQRKANKRVPQPGLTLSDPLISVLWGVMAFHEQVRQGWYVLGEVVSAGIIVAGVIMLARSSLLSGDSSSGGEGEPARGSRAATAGPGGHSAHPAPDRPARGGTGQRG